MTRKRRGHSLGMFQSQAEDYSRVYGTETKMMACPLCMKVFDEGAIPLLSEEHVVPRKLRGRARVLTCEKCNNENGSRLDRHLVGAMKAADSLDGHLPVRSRLLTPNGPVNINMLLRDGSRESPITLRTVGHASSPPALAAIPSQLIVGGQLEIEMNLDFIPERYWRAALRSAYLAVFKAHGYDFVVSAGGEQVRRAFTTDEPIEPGLVLRALPDVEPTEEILVMPLSFSDIGECTAVLLRVVSKKTRYLAVLLPGKDGCSWRDLARLHAAAPQLRIETHPDSLTRPMYIYLDYDPVQRMHDQRLAGVRPRSARFRVERT